MSRTWTSDAVSIVHSREKILKRNSYSNHFYHEMENIIQYKISHKVENTKNHTRKTILLKSHKPLCMDLIGSHLLAIRTYRIADG